MNTYRRVNQGWPGTLMGLIAAMVFVAAVQAADRTEIPIPETRAKRSWTQRQRARYFLHPTIERGHKAIARGDYEEACRLFEKVLEKDPLHNHARVFLIEIYNLQGEYETGIKVANDLLRDYPAYYDLYLSKGFMELKLDRLGDAIRSLEILREQAPPRYPKLDTALENLAIAYFKVERYRQAMTLMEELVEREETVERRIFIAECAIRRKQSVAAAFNLERAIELSDVEERKAALQLKLGYVYSQLQRYSDAEKALQLGKGGEMTEEERTRIATQLAQNSFGDGNFAEAAERFESLLRQGFNEDLAAGRLQALSKLGQSKRCIQEANRFLQQGGISKAFTEKALVTIMYAHKDLDDDVSCYVTATKLLNEFPKTEYLLEAGAAAERMNEFDEAIRLYLTSLEQNFDPVVGLNCHYALKKKAAAEEAAGNAQEARALREESIELLGSLKELAELPDDISFAVTYELAQAYRAIGDFASYSSVMEGLLRDDPDPALLHEYAVELYAQGRYPEALELFEACLDKDFPDEIKFDACLAMAAIRLFQQETGTARQWLERAVEYGEKNDRWHLEMARADFQDGNYEACIERLLPESEGNDLFNLYIGFSFYKLKMPGLALLHLNRVAEPEKLEPLQRYNFSANRAYLLFDQDQYEEALDDVEQALSFQSSEELEIVRLKTLVRLGRYKTAADLGKELVRADANDDLRAEIIELLQEHPEPKFRAAMLEKLGQLGSQEQADLLHLIGLCELRLGHYDDAVQYLTLAIERDPTYSESYYLRGLANFKAERYEAAEEDFLVLYDQATRFPPTFWGDLGLLEGAKKDYALGTAALDKSLEIYMYDIDTAEETGYQYMKWNKNNNAKEAFAYAIDLYTTVLPYLPQDEAAGYDDARRSMKQEYMKLDKVFGLQGYISKTDYNFQSDREGVAVDSTEGALQSQAGVGVRYRPPDIGFRNERQLDVMGRVLANFKPDSWDLDSDSYQGAVGAQYKPFSSLNYNTSFERLFKIGDNAEENWLWRNMLSFERGEKPRRDEEWWMHNKFYGEVSYYLDSPERWIYYVDLGLSPVFPVNDRILLNLPEVKGVGRYQSDDADGVGTYSYVGLGPSLRILDREREYATEKWYLDLYAHYTWGWFNETPEGFEDRNFDGLIFGVNFVK
ncbi:MAG: tetratricopeptide repeat protein [Verrucomicrobia bacterium]|nr:tetratricopeptide repeat protein [Verrucomicrobiota bacterium]